jgi:hypothetical protein
MGATRGRPASVACMLCFAMGGGRRPGGPKAEWAGWLFVDWAESQGKFLLEIK